MPGDTNNELGDKGVATRLHNAGNASGGGTPQKGHDVIDEDGKLVIGGAEAAGPPTKEAVTKAEGASEAPAVKEPMVSFFKLLSFADTYDYVLMFFGTFGAVVHGAAVPIFFLFFGRLLNGLGGVTEQPTHTVNKMGNFIHFMGTFVAGFAVGFSNEWGIALVTSVAVVPLIAMAGGFYGWTLKTATTRVSESYAAAGTVAEQAIAQVRTVYSSVGESKFSGDYSAALHKTMKIRIPRRAGQGYGPGIHLRHPLRKLGAPPLVRRHPSTRRHGGWREGAGYHLRGLHRRNIRMAAHAWPWIHSLGQAMPNVAAFANGRAGSSLQNF